MDNFTRDDMLTRWGESELIQRTDRTRVGAIDEAVLAAAMDLAQTDIDGALADAGYTPPVVWARLKPVGLDLARYYLYEGTRPKEIQDGYSAAIAFLDKVSTGGIRPPGLTQDATPPASAGPEYVAGTPAFGDLTDFLGG